MTFLIILKMSHDLIKAYFILFIYFFSLFNYFLARFLKMVKLIPSVLGVNTRHSWEKRQSIRPSFFMNESIPWNKQYCTLCATWPSLHQLIKHFLLFNAYFFCVWPCSVLTGCNLSALNKSCLFSFIALQPL